MIFQKFLKYSLSFTFFTNGQEAERRKRKISFLGLHKRSLNELFEFPKSNIFEWLATIQITSFLDDFLMK